MSMKIKNKMHSLSIASTVTLILSIIFILATVLFGTLGTIFAVLFTLTGGSFSDDQLQVFMIIVIFALFGIILFITSTFLSIIALLKKDVNKFSKNTSLICLIISLCIIVLFTVVVILSK